MPDITENSSYSLPDQNLKSSKAKSFSTEPIDLDLEKSISLASLDKRLPSRVLELVKANYGEQTWQAFWATVVKGDSATDVAERLKMSVTSVYQAKSRILRRLRERMSELP